MESHPAAQIISAMAQIETAFERLIRARASLAVQSWHLMDRIDGEPFWFGCPLFADELVEREAFECIQSSPEVVGADEVDEVAP